VPYLQCAARICEVQQMDEKIDQMGPRERQIVDLLLQGCDNSEIARDLNMAERTVKAYFNRLFVRFGIKGGIKRVKLATLLYRRQLWQERRGSSADPTNANTSSFNA
jgi:DNA-binding NarL/FixJ family response regulator